MISAVNLVEGGTLTVLREVLVAARATLSPRWRIVALVHDSRLFDVPGIEYRELPLIKASWWRRVWFEYAQCRALSKQLAADLWLALHDMTPIVHARRQAVYCHNPMPFYAMKMREIRWAPKLLVFSLFYGWLYRINIRRNHAVIVQQDWLRKEFKIRFKAENVIVARPSHPIELDTSAPPKQGKVFIYPALPRPFKNFDVIGEAVSLLERNEQWQGEVRITLKGDENAYAADLLRRFGHLHTLRFVGLQTQDQMTQQYAQSQALIFPSKLETWGMPISEAQAHGLAILAADLPYAHATIGRYNATAFFDPHDAKMLATKMLEFHLGRLTFEPHNAPEIPAPRADDWPSLIEMLVDGL